MNYADLFRVTLPESMLELAALAVLIADLGLLRKASTQVRLAVAAVLGVLGCGAAAWMLQYSGTTGLAISSTGALILATGGAVTVAQAGILALTAVTLLLLFGTVFTRHVGEFVAVVLMAATGGLLVAAAQDLMVIFVGLELLSLGLYILTAFAKSSEKSAEAALKYYLFGGMSAAFLLLGFSYLYGLTGATNLTSIYTVLLQTGATQSPLFFVAVVAITAGLGFKVAAVPFHLWAPDTYEGAPAPAAAFIASVSKIASFALLLGFVLARAVAEGQSGALTGSLSGSLVGSLNGSLADGLRLASTARVVGLIFALAGASIVLGNLAALAQTSVRRLLAYSAIAHAGYILIGVGAALQANAQPGANIQAVLYYALTYGLTTVGAFGVIGVVEQATGSDRLDAFLGLHKRSPILAAVLFVLLLSLAGIPPLVGFWAKFNLFAAVLGQSGGVIPFVLVALALAASAVSLYYYLQVLKRAYVLPAIDERPIKTHPVVLVALVLIATTVVLLGVLPSVLGDWIANLIG